MSHMISLSVDLETVSTVYHCTSEPASDTHFWKIQHISLTRSQIVFFGIQENIFILQKSKAEKPDEPMEEEVSSTKILSHLFCASRFTKKREKSPNPQLKSQAEDDEEEEEVFLDAQEEIPTPTTPRKRVTFNLELQTSEDKPNIANNNTPPAATTPAETEELPAVSAGDSNGTGEHRTQCLFQERKTSAGGGGGGSKASKQTKTSRLIRTLKQSKQVQKPAKLWLQSTEVFLT